MRTPIAEEDVRIVPANEASLDDLRAVLGSGDPSRCQCQRLKILGWIWTNSTSVRVTAVAA